MVSSSRLESLAQRFASYIDELHGFFRSRGVPFGTRQDLQTFPLRLQDASFQEEMVSMVRSILYSENEAVSRTDLEELLTIALAGADLDDSTDSVTAPRPLLDFVTQVVRSQRFTLPPEAPEEEISSAPVAAVAAPAAAMSTAQPPMHLVVTPEPAALTSPIAPAPATPATPLPTKEPPQVQSVTSESQEAGSNPINDRLSRALFAFEKGQGEQAPDPTEPEPKPVDRPTVRIAAPERPAYPSPIAARPRSAAGFLRNAYWLPGVCALLLVLCAAFLLRRPHAKAPTPLTAAAQPPYVPTSQVGKPSAYGPLLKGGRAHRQSAESADSSSASMALPPATPPANVGASELHAPDRHPGDSSTAPSTRRLTPLASSRVTPRVLGGREGVFLASSGAMAAHLLAAPAPHYPKLASLTHVEGEVIVQVVVGRDGGVEATRSLEGPLLLRGAAEHAIRHWRYRPYLVDGKPTDVATIVTVNFRLTH